MNYADAPPLFGEDKPSGADKIWRYLDLSKFLSMLETQSIYFATEFELTRADRWEGAFGSWKVRNRLYGGESAIHDFAIQEAVFNGNAKIIDYFRRRQANERDKDDELFGLAVSCWHHSESESAAMWKLYTRGEDGVAIRTSVSSLLRILQADGKQFDYGKVTYLSDEDAERHRNLHPLQSVFAKRAVYTYENEVRFVLSSRGPLGFPVRIELASFVDEIVLSPDYPEWAEMGLRHTLDQLALNELSVKIRRSSVGDDPTACMSTTAGK